MRIIAEAVGCHIDTIFRIKRAENRPSIELAVRLEKFLKIDRRRWLWPEEFGDPWAIFYARYE
jgi:plasmid maintenance system antidote protein VapI